MPDLNITRGIFSSGDQSDEAKGFAGAVVADEPQAVLAARDILVGGGNAADAAVTLYFSLAVTLPSTAGLGGGGTCLAYDHGNAQVDSIDFPALAPPFGGTLSVAIPSVVRGMLTLHLRHGSVPWEILLQGPERMAREGIQISRAFARDLAGASTLLSADSDARRLFFNADGRVLGEGEHMSNFELAAVLTTLRRAPGDFYNGQFVRGFTDGVARIGGGIGLQDMRAVEAKISNGTVVALGSDSLILPGGRGDLAALVDWLKARPPEQRAQSVADTLALPDPTHPPAPGTTFAVMDGSGDAVVCAISSNGLFGTGRVAPGTGIFLAVPSPAKPAAVPVMILTPASGAIRFVGGAGGGASPGAAILEAALDSAENNLAVSQAVAQSSVSAVPGGAARVNAIACGSGKSGRRQCTAAVAPGASGYGVLEERTQ